MANETREYSRTRDNTTDRLTVMSYLHDENPDDPTDTLDEIRLIHTVNNTVVSDEIAYHGPAGHSWLTTKHTEWTATGYTPA